MKTVSLTFLHVHFKVKIIKSTSSFLFHFKFLLVTSVFACCYAKPAISSYDAGAETRSFTSDIKEDGSYNYQFETSNGIVAQESGVGGQYASGSSAYYAPDGQLIQLQYTADENGYHPVGDHLPTPPPIPAAILKSLEYIRTHPSQENRQGQEKQQQYQPQQYQQQAAPRYQQPQQYYQQQQQNRYRHA